MKILISDAFDNALPGKLARFGEVTDNKDRLQEAEDVLIRVSAMRSSLVRWSPIEGTGEAEISVVLFEDGLSISGTVTRRGESS